MVKVETRHAVEGSYGSEFPPICDGDYALFGVFVIHRLVHILAKFASQYMYQICRL